MARAQIDTPTSQPVRNQRADARRNRESVLEAARKEFARHGLDAQMPDIARSAGVGVGTVYRHFPTKLDLLQALADARFEGLAEAARKALEVKDPWAGFEQLMRYSARVMATDNALSEAMDQQPGVCKASAQKVGMLELTSQVVARAQASGDLRDDFQPEDVPALMAGLGRAVRSSVERPTMSWERHIDIILAGVRNR